MKNSYFGEFGGCFVPELLMPPLLEVEAAMRRLLPAAEFQAELDDLLRNFAGRPTPLTYCPALSGNLGFHLWLKREDLLHTGAHKINNTLGQALLAKKMGKTALVAETGAGQHGVATAAAAARLGMKCDIYMGSEDVARQAPNVMRMKLLGAEVHAVESGTRTLKDAINEALRAWISSQESTHYCFGTAAGPHPFPTLVREFQSVIGRETRARFLEKTGGLPDAVVACVGGGSNAIGLFYPFLEETSVRIIGVEAAGTGEPGCFNSAPLNLGAPGVLHGNYTMLLQNRDGQIEPSHSISAGLDYPGVGPEHARLHKTGRVRYGMVKDANALAAFHRLCRAEGILPALESSHALAYVLDHPADFAPGSAVVVNLSGRGDKDMGIVAASGDSGICAVRTAECRENGMQHFKRNF
ncbi:MAG: tryptophan synthase subunit beta [Desulfovibrio sp.]|jgi:tryptophan synthase beta chain|nr:tryptophan synthase subunit beta [Desulfovibrio sp.]